ncbi:MAG: MarR family transcriptional regulator [Oscillatoriales cyanobacterium RU_3_3]|nr:MarR family transcriptional regulator [Oscillatoriales cyanobacterium RU_3_3]NJR26072.1 MarR family transcriptional regulator [Richelia sp. CSU_2_1]
MNLERTSKGITPERCAAEVVETILPIVGFIRMEMRDRGEPSLSVSQFRSLMFLYRHPGSSLSKLADHLGVTRPTATAICDRLVLNGFVDRAEHPQERRSVALKLTQEGIERLDRIRSITCTKIAGMFGDLSEDRMQKILEGLAVLSDVFDSDSKNS